MIIFMILNLGVFYLVSGEILSAFIHKLVSIVLFQAIRHYLISSCTLVGLLMSLSFIFLKFVLLISLFEDLPGTDPEMSRFINEMLL
jgi:hypothetical protein